VPHAPVVPQVAVQFTPRFPVSGAAVAARTAVDPTEIVAGGAEAAGIVTMIGAVVTTVAIVDADTAGLLVDFAVIVTVLPGGTAVGPTKEIAVPLAV
jgi:hypothetical protein